MSAASGNTRKHVEAQGYLGLSDSRLAEIAPWIRFAPALCMAWAAVATLFASTAAVGALVVIAAVGALLKSHPFEALYNHGFRHMLGHERLPAAGAPRRFACAVATVWLTAAGLAFYLGATSLGYMLGGSMAAAAAVPTFTGFCIPSFFLWDDVRQARTPGRLAGPGRLDPAIERTRTRMDLLWH